MRILVVEDNTVLADTIKEELSRNVNLDVEVLNNGEDALYYIERSIYDIIILDIMLPDLSGIEILRIIRNKGIKTPVIILTAKEELDDKVGAFSIGANDYVTKPFYMEELVARVYAVLRTTGSISNENILEFKDLKMNLDSRTVYIGNQEIELYKKQFDILEYFLMNKKQVLLKEQIYDRIWGIDCDIPIEIVEVHISGLRKSLLSSGYNKYIKTKRGIGYIFDDE
ncbi:MAG: response regulator transcription factor [Paeniclostridium sp.]|uniref:response regulator transcription factor n=1 Tax=Paraclostridium sordellii TaxID=1505 RepID=UPI0005433039|nr:MULTISPECIES: response regulator transcription factor [Paeniclostridium]MBW4863831.1 response regulator transcription factor [Paeniclostridium sp.]MBW4872942.1 response regulator transcription factor [Paeniclostridium sp.]CEK33617.1 two-component response regulator,Mycobacterial persistence regulator A,DNA-binding transcriptional regulator BasR,Response regulator of citrate/malate metabolism,phosphate regulon transcriptional regulatory protein PhoB,Response regulator receiver domain [[Clostri